MDSIIPVFGLASAGLESIITNISGYGERCGSSFTVLPVSLRPGRIHVYAQTGSGSSYLNPVIIFGASGEEIDDIPWSSDVSPSYHIFISLFYVSETVNNGLYTIYVGNKKYENVSKIEADNAASNAFIYWITLS